MTEKGSSTIESLFPVLQPQIGLYQNLFKNVLNAMTFCSIAAHVTVDTVVFLEAVDRLNPATTIASSSLMVRV